MQSMETSFSTRNVKSTKYVNNLQITMDYDSGYMSHNPESNLDSSLDNSHEGTLNSEFSKTVYLSEDALLEKPEVKSKYHNLSLEIENEDYEETRCLFYSPEKDKSSIIIPSSVTSHETNYSGFNDTESEESDTSVEIPTAKAIIVDATSITETLNVCNNDKAQKEYNLMDNSFPNVTDQNNFCGKLDKKVKQNKLTSALNDITNQLFTNDPKKKLTLVFSKVDRENVYSVKRKYCSLTPEKTDTSSEEINTSLEESFNSEENVSTEENISSLSTTQTSDNIEIPEQSDTDKFLIQEVPVPSVHPKSLMIEEITSEQKICTPEIIFEQKIHDGSILGTNEVSEEDKFKVEINEVSEDVKCNAETNMSDEVKIHIETNELFEEDKIKVEINVVSEDVKFNVEINDLYDEVKAETIEILADDKFNAESNETFLDKELHLETNKVDEEVNGNLEIINISEKVEPQISETDGFPNDSQFMVVPLTEAVEGASVSKCEVKSDINQNSKIINIPRQSFTPKKKFLNPIDPNISPDLFGEEDFIQQVAPEDQLPLNFIAEEKYIIKKDSMLIKKASNSLKGVLPPHSVTVIQMSVDEMLNKIEVNKDYFWGSSKITQSKDESLLDMSTESNKTADGCRSLLISEFEECRQKEWPKILEGRFHGLHYNRSKLSEQFEDLCTKYFQRYVGAETQSSCTVFEINNPSPMKRRQIKQRWSVKSPGRRLSHLARRRITFSSANLQASGSSFAGSRARQILVDAKKLDLLKRRSPKKSPRKTPSKSPRKKTRTPSSSAKKKLAMRFRKLTGEIEKTNLSSETAVLSSKRALFQSPDRDKKSSLFLPSTSGISAFENEIKKPTKRALFMSPSKSSPLKNSPFKKSPFKRLELGLERKRKRSECDDSNPSKLARSMSVDLRPSDSECKSLNRTKSELNMSLSQSQAGELSNAHKKKLQWAVYEALRFQNITPSHPQFKVYASNLARVTRRLLPHQNNNALVKDVGTSERMLRITRYHIYSVLKGKTVDEIVQEYLRNKSKHLKPHGYVAIEEFNSGRKTLNKENVSQDRANILQSLERKKLEVLGKPKSVSNKIDRIRKVINFGDDDNR